MHRKITELRPHPKNLEIYGVEPVSPELLTSIKLKGVMVPLTIKADGTIISGHRRYEAAKSAGIESVPVGIATFSNELDELEALIEFNRQREKTFTQKMREAEALEKIEKERARARQTATLMQGEERPVKEIFPERETGQTRDKVAKATGIGSGKTYDIAKKIWEKADAGDDAAKEIVQKIDRGELTIHGGKKELEKEAKVEKRKADIQAQKDAIENGTVQMPVGVFEVISLDPPWNYGREYDPDGSRVANPYPEMTQAQLLELKPPFADDSVCFLWTTQAFIWQAKELLDKWGFTYKATIVWDKEKIGMGAWLRMQCEFCLVGIKGKPAWNNTSWRDIIRESRREHSRKPDTFYRMVEEITIGRRLEYFSREQRKGWEVFGNDTEKF